MSLKKSIKKRNWSFIMYPESAPTEWKSILESTGLKIAVSPLHDKDLKDGPFDETLNVELKSGAFKKAHWHVLLHFDGPTTDNIVSSISSSVNASNPIPVESLKGSFEYLWHANSPDKFQYCSDDVLLLNGFRIESLCELSSDDILRLKKSIQKIIIDEKIFEYSDLMDYLLSNELDPEYRLASTSTIFFAKYIDSRRHKSNKGGFYDHNR